jgi:hypothetical protein
MHQQKNAWQHISKGINPQLCCTKVQAETFATSCFQK